MNWNEDTLPPPQKSNFSIFIAVAALLLGAYLGFSVFSRREPPAVNEGITHPSVGEVLTDLRFEPLLNTPDAVTSADLKGKVAVVNFWGTWCPPCRVEFPHLVTLQKDFAADKDFQFVSVSVTSNGGDELKVKEPTEKFLQQQKAKFPVYIDPDRVSRKHLLQAGKIPQDHFGYPATVLLDREGVIRGLWVGFYPGMEVHLADTIRQTLAAKSAPAVEVPQEPQATPE